jgi:hypothetical protein
MWILQTRIVLNNLSSKENYRQLEFIDKTTTTMKSIAEYQGFWLTVKVMLNGYQI